jgi:hypothetical protein
MQALREALPVHLIAPTIYRDTGDIGENAAISQRFAQLRSRSHLGIQYDWLARFVAEEGITEIELSLHRGTGPAAMLAPYVQPSRDGYVLSPDADPELSIFRAFRFPLFDMTKLDMQEAADQHGFRHLLEKTWFCHSPTARGLACGTCGPCRYARNEGLARRIPVSGHSRYYGWGLKQVFKRTALGGYVASVRRARRAAPARGVSSLGKR